MPSVNDHVSFRPYSPARRRRRGTGWPSFARTKDIDYHPFFLGAISRWVWRVYAYRFTRPSLWLLAVTFLFVGYGSSSLDLQAYVPLSYLIAIWVLAIAGANLFRPRVTLKAHHVDRIGVGEMLPIEIEVCQQRRWSGADLTVIPHRLPPDLDAVPEDGARLAPLVFGQTAHARLALRCLHRGAHQWYGFRVETDFPLGLLRAYRTYPQRHELLVYPKFTPLTGLNLPTGRRYNPGGVALASDLGESAEFIGNREYREGDSVRDIDWRATARLNIPIVREYRQEYFLRAAVILDTYVPAGAAPERWNDFERAVSLCAAISDCMARSEYLVDLFAAGPNLYHLAAGRSLAYLDQILDILACVDASVSEPFSVLEPEIGVDLACITTILCVFLDWNEVRQDFVQRLARAGSAVRVIIVRNGACSLAPGSAALPDPVIVISQADFDAGIREL